MPVHLVICVRNVLNHSMRNEQIPMEKMGNYAASRIKVDRFFDHSYFLAPLLRYSPICAVSLAKVS